MRGLFILAFFLLPSSFVLAATAVNQPEERSIDFKSKALTVEYRYMDIDESGYVSNTTSDSYLILNGFDLPRDQACFIVIDAEFKEPMFRPGLFEAFWAVNPGAFSEKQKARFLISHKNTHSRTMFIVPLCKLYNFSGNLDSPHHQRNIVGLRLDYPMNRTVGLKIRRLDLIGLKELKMLEQESEIVELEAFERLSGNSFTSLDVVVPKIYFALESGWKRLSQDLLFLGVWLALIFGLLFLLIRGKRS